MISFVRGSLSDVAENKVIVEAGGVGYEIFVPGTVISELPPTGSDVKIYTYHQIKEDSQSLYGFLYKEDREMFERLISVNGVGPKGALAILSILKPDDLRLAIITGDSKTISRAQGVGKRIAERIILELRDKLSSMELSAPLGEDAGYIAPILNNSVSGPVSEAMEALTALGYSRSEAGRLLGLIDINKDMSTEDILKSALKRIRV